MAPVVPAACIAAACCAAVRPPYAPSVPAKPPKTSAPAPTPPATSPAPIAPSASGAAAPPVIAAAVAAASITNPGCKSFWKLNPDPPLAASLAMRCTFLLRPSRLLPPNIELISSEESPAACAALMVLSTSGCIDSSLSLRFCPICQPC